VDILLAIVDILSESNDLHLWRSELKMDITVDVCLLWHNKPEHLKMKYSLILLYIYTHARMLGQIMPQNVYTYM